MKHLNYSELPFSIEQISCNLWFMSAPSKLHFFSSKSIMLLFFFLHLMNYILSANCIIQPPPKQAMDVCACRDLPQLNEGMSCSAFAAFHKLPSFLQLSSHSQVTAPCFCTFSCCSPVACYCLSPHVPSSSSVVSIPVQCLQLGATSAFYTPRIHRCLHGASLWCSFFWVCCKVKPEMSISISSSEWNKAVTTTLRAELFLLESSSENPQGWRRRQRMDADEAAVSNAGLLLWGYSLSLSVSPKLSLAAAPLPCSHPLWRLKRLFLYFGKDLQNISKKAFKIGYGSSD